MMTNWIKIIKSFVQWLRQSNKNIINLIKNNLPKTNYIFSPINAIMVICVYLFRYSLMAFFYELPQNHNIYSQVFIYLVVVFLCAARDIFFILL